MTRPLAAVSLKALADTRNQRRGMLKIILLSIHRILLGAIVMLFAGNSSLLLKSTLLHRLQKVFTDKRLMTCYAEFAWYQQLRDMACTDSFLCILEKLSHR